MIAVSLLGFIPERTSWNSPIFYRMSGQTDELLPVSRYNESPQHHEAEGTMQRLTAVCLIFSVPTVVLTVAAQVEGDAFLFPGALKLSRQADIGLWNKEIKKGEVKKNRQGSNNIFRIKNIYKQ